MIARLLALTLLVSVNMAAAEDSQLPVGVQSALNVRNVPHESLSIYVEDLDAKETLLQWHADVPIRNHFGARSSTLRTWLTVAGACRQGLVARARFWSDGPFGRAGVAAPGRE